jgi:hypothetical protein
VTRKTMTLEDIQDRKAYLNDELHKLAIAESELLDQSSVIKKGEKVRRTFGAMKDVLFIVEQVHHVKGSDKPWVSGYMVKKDGSPGMQLKHLYYEWEKVDDGVSSER